MERSQPPLPQKSNSFSVSREAKLRETDRNFSLGSIRFEDRTPADADTDINKPDTIDEGEEEAEEVEVEKVVDEKGNVDSANNEDDATVNAEETPHTDDLNTLAEDIDRFLLGLHERSNVEAEEGENAEPLPEIPTAIIDKFVTLVEKEIAKYESGAERLSPEHHDDEPSVLDAFDRLSKLTEVLLPFSSSNSAYFDAATLTSSVLHHAMSFLEDEFFSLLDESSSAAKKQDQGSNPAKAWRPPSFGRSSTHDQDRGVSSPSADQPTPAADSYPSPEIVARLRIIANSMIAAGYDAECFQVFAVARGNAVSAAMSDLGFEKISIDDVQRMPWDSLEVEIGKWNKAFRAAIDTSLPMERDLFDTVFAAHRSAAGPLFHRLAFGTVLSLLSFPEALAMTKRSTEKLFKVLDVHDALKDTIPKIDPLLITDDDTAEPSPIVAELKSEMYSVQSRLGETAVATFCDLESSIRSDAGKNAVPGGAVHPLTRYVMNYLKLACEYIGTLEQIFKDHDNITDGSIREEDEENDRTPFASQVTLVMDLLQANLDSKAKLYKDPALSNIFLMNNGRYIMQKIKGSAEIKRVLGDNWCRKRSSELRQYHGNYKRETWLKVVACLKDDGLMVKGSIVKPVLKERFKSFNALFEEIHKAQSMWVVSDEQLQSELRVSVSAIVVPAYRSFLGRFQQYLTPGRQTEKYIKFAPEDLETYIDELFDGNPSSLAVKKR